MSIGEKKRRKNSYRCSRAYFFYRLLSLLFQIIYHVYIYSERTINWVKKSSHWLLNMFFSIERIHHWNYWLFNISDYLSIRMNEIFSMTSRF